MSVDVRVFRTLLSEKLLKHNSLLFSLIVYYAAQLDEFVVGIHWEIRVFIWVFESLLFDNFHCGYLPEKGNLESIMNVAPIFLVF